MAKQIGGMSEQAAVEVAYHSSYHWHLEHGYSTPTMADLEMRLHETARTQSFTAAVLSWMAPISDFTDEGDRRYRISKRAFNKVRKMWGGN